VFIENARPFLDFFYWWFSRVYCFYFIKPITPDSYDVQLSGINGLIALSLIISSQREFKVLSMGDHEVSGLKGQ